MAYQEHSQRNKNSSWKKNIKRDQSKETYKLIFVCS